MADDRPSIRLTTEILDRLRRRLPGLAVTIERDVACDHVVLPSLPENDYRFVLSSCDDREVSIEARRRGGPSGEYFWDRRFEEWDYPDEEARIEEIVTTAVLLLTHRSCITQTRGLLFWSFEVQVEIGDQWASLASMACLRGMFRVPEIAGRARVFRAEAVLPPI